MGRIKYAVDSPHTSAWVTRIGKLVVNFSALEMECIHWLIQLSEDPKALAAFAETPFKARATQTMRYVEMRSTSASWRKQALRMWNQAIKLGEIRNRVAHNPVVFAWTEPAEAGEPDFVGVPTLRQDGAPAKESLLSKVSADQAINDIAALAQQLQLLRSQWCRLRDDGKAPPVLPVARKARPFSKRLKAVAVALRGLFSPA